MNPDHVNLLLRRAAHSFILELMPVAGLSPCPGAGRASLVDSACTSSQRQHTSRARVVIHHASPDLQGTGVDKISALKEWAPVCGAVAKGRQHVLLRKGGLHDRGGFKLTADTFLLLPNSFHSAEQLLAATEVEALREV